MRRRLLTLSLLLLLSGTLGTPRSPATGQYGDAGDSIFAACAHYARQRHNARGRVEISTGEPALDLARQPSLQVTPIVVINADASAPLGKVMARAGTGRETALRRAGQSKRRVRRFCQPRRRDVGRHDIETRRAVPQEDLRGDGRRGSPRSTAHPATVAFGVEGTIGLREGLRIPPAFPTAYQVTSPPLCRRPGSRAFHRRQLPACPQAASTRVRCANGHVALTHPIPQDPNDRRSRPGATEAPRAQAPNAWSILTADPSRDLIFVPTSSPAPDYYGALRPGDNGTRT
jgi:hypothetical protein